MEISIRDGQEKMCLFVLMVMACWSREEEQTERAAFSSSDISSVDGWEWVVGMNCIKWKIGELSSMTGGPNDNGSLQIWHDGSFQLPRSLPKWVSGRMNGWLRMPKWAMAYLWDTDRPTLWVHVYLLLIVVSVHSICMVIGKGSKERAKAIWLETSTDSQFFHWRDVVDDDKRKGKVSMVP